MSLQTEDTWSAIRNDWPPLVPDFDLVADRTALVIIDVQEHNTKAGGDLIEGIVEEYPAFGDYYYPRLEEIVIPNIARLLDFFRTNGMRVVYTKTGALLQSREDLAPCAMRNRMDFIGEEQMAVVPELSPREGELVLFKNTYSAFTSTGIHHILQTMGITDLVFAGATTDGCVETTARDAADHGYNCYLIEDACGTLSQRQQQATMEAFTFMFGHVSDTQSIVKSLER